MGRPAKKAPGVGTRLAEIRGSDTREEFAQSIGVHANTIANYERGDRKVDSDFLALLSSTMNVDVNWLLTGEGAPFVPYKIVEIGPEVAVRLDMKQHYVRAIYNRLHDKQDELKILLERDAFWFALAMVNQVMIEKFGGREASHAEMEPLLVQYVDNVFPTRSDDMQNCE